MSNGGLLRPFVFRLELQDEAIERNHEPRDRLPMISRLAPPIDLDRVQASLNAQAALIRISADDGGGSDREMKIRDGLLQSADLCI